jgi:branched-chain amino acid aminotransferase
VPDKVWLNGNLVPPSEAAINVYDHGLLYGDGVFEGIRVYGGRIFKCATHLRRLVDSAKSLRLSIPYSNDELTAAMNDTLAANKLENGYIRLCVTRGVGTLGLNPLNCEKASVFIIADAITLYPREMYESGMAIITSSVVRNHPASLSPRIKSMNYLPNIMAKIEALDAGVMEAVMLNAQGLVAECTGDNIFIVREWEGRSTLITPPLHAGVLEGVTMNVVIELARQADIPVLRMDMTKHDLYVADEMFLTGTAAEVIPVTMVDGRVIGAGSPGPITLQLIKAFREMVTNHAPQD